MLAKGLGLGILYHYLRDHRAPTISRLLNEENLKVSRFGIAKFLKKYKETSCIGRTGLLVLLQKLSDPLPVFFSLNAFKVVLRFGCFFDIADLPRAAPVCSIALACCFLRIFEPKWRTQNFTVYMIEISYLIYVAFPFLHSRVGI